MLLDENGKWTLQMRVLQATAGASVAYAVPATRASRLLIWSAEHLRYAQSMFYCRCGVAEGAKEDYGRVVEIKRCIDIRVWGSCREWERVCRIWLRRLSVLALGFWETVGLHSFHVSTLVNSPRSCVRPPALMCSTQQHDRHHGATAGLWP